MEPESEFHFIPHMWCGNETVLKHILAVFPSHFLSRLTEAVYFTSLLLVNLEFWLNMSFVSLSKFFDYYSSISSSFSVVPFSLITLSSSSSTLSSSSLRKSRLIDNCLGDFSICGLNSFPSSQSYSLSSSYLNGSNFGMYNRS